MEILDLIQTQKTNLAPESELSSCAIASESEFKQNSNSQNDKNSLYHFVKKYNITKPFFIGYCIAFSLILYFTFFTIFSEKGLIQLFVLKQHIENKEFIKQELSAKMQAKKNMVDGMNSEALDLDLLDEQARKVLGYAGKNEVVIYHDNKPNSQN